MSIVVYTAVFGPIRDQLQSLLSLPGPPDPTVAYIAFTDDVTSPVMDTTGWLKKPAYWQHKNPRLRARRHKLLSHQLFPSAEYSLWLDGCLTPVINPADLCDKYMTHQDICLFEHMQRSCVYQEAAACKKLKKDDPAVIDSVVARYRREGYPENHGLGETTCMLRRHTDDVKKFNEAWWEELKNNSIRDQLSFNYLIWKLGLDYATFQGNRTNSPHFSWIPHR